MRKYFFVSLFSTIVGAAYLYIAMRVGSGVGDRVVLALPFLLFWMLPIVFWRSRDKRSVIDEHMIFLSHLSMGWLSFVFIFSLLRDGTTLLAMAVGAESVVQFLGGNGALIVLAGSTLGVLAGMINALRGPRLKEVVINFKELDPRLSAFRIVQVSDLHAGGAIRRSYVENVVRKTRELKPNLIALTGDIVDGKVANLRDIVQPLSELPKICPTFFVLGNHEYYSNAGAWVEYFKSIGVTVLLNESSLLDFNGGEILVGGVTDAAASQVKWGPKPQPELANGSSLQHQNLSRFKLLLAHNPKLAKAGADAGFDLQLSGHTHAGQFFPWNFVIHLVHAPHVVGLSEEGAMKVYVSPGTGSWGPPIRLGTSPELTLIRLSPDSPNGLL